MKLSFTKKRALVVGVTTAVAAGALWSGYAPSSKPAQAAVSKSAFTSIYTAASTGASPAARSVPVSVDAEAKPRNEAQAKLGGQLLQALQAITPASSATGASTAPNATSSISGASPTQRVPVARQIQALVQAGVPAKLRSDNRVSVHVDLAVEPEYVAQSDVLKRIATELRDSFGRAGIQASQIVGSAVLEASIPLDRLEWAAANPLVARIDLQTLPTYAQAAPVVTTTQGALASEVQRLHDLNLNGEGITIAVIDGFDNTEGEIAALQASGDWPDAAHVQTRRDSGGAFGQDDSSHGNAVLEIAYDLAPQASFIAYDTRNNSDWAAAVRHAANLDDDNVALGAPRAQVITASLGFENGSIGDGSGRLGFLKGLYDAIRAARDNGVVVLNAAGNEAQKHWGGATQVDASNYQRWNAAGDTYNLLYGGQCFPVGTQYDLSASVFWNDWAGGANPNNTTDQDYSLHLYRRGEPDRRTGVRPWIAVANANATQNGRAGQVPVESVQYQPPANQGTRECDGVYPNGIGGAVFAVRVRRITAGANNNLQLFANWQLGTAVAERSISFPADTPDVLTIAALNVGDSALEPYSSRGPILSAGGALPGDEVQNTLKPDLASFANVDTVSYGAGEFAGTSAATPHVAGLAALVLQRQQELAEPNASDSVERRRALANAVRDSLQQVARTQGNDLGVAGHDGSYGYGRLRFHAQTASCLAAAAYRGNIIDFLNPQLTPEQRLQQVNLNQTACERVPAVGGAIAKG